MKSIIEKIKSNVLLSLLTAVLLGIAILQLSQFFGNLTNDWIEKFYQLNFYTGNVFMKFFMLVLSLLLIIIVNNGSLKGYGFNKPEKLKYVRFILISSGIIIASFIVGQIIFNGILRTLFPPESKGMGFPENQSILEMILTVWIWSSICEEVLTRGFIQGFMSNQIKIRFLKLSLPVWVSGIFFGMMHLSLLKTNMDIWFVSFIVFNTTVLGLLAAYYREKSKSIYPAIFVHFWANVLGSLPLLIMKFFI